MDEQEYIILPIIENEAKKIISEINEKYLFKTERILFIEDLEKDFPNISLLIPYLYSTNIAVSWEWKGRQVIKFRSESETKVQYSEIDNGIISLKTTQSILQLQIDRISEGILNYKKLATKAGKDGNKPLAYSYIRRKKQLEDISNKRHSALETIQTILVSIQNADTDKEIFDALKLGNNSLTVAVKENGVDVDTVEDIMIDVQQALQDQQEIDMAIIENEKQINNIDDSELLEELERLTINELPKVPENSPIKPITVKIPITNEEDIDKQMEELLNKLPNLNIEEPVKEVKVERQLVHS